MPPTRGNQEKPNFDWSTIGPVLRIAPSEQLDVTGTKYLMMNQVWASVKRHSGEVSLKDSLLECLTVILRFGSVRIVPRDQNQA